MRRLKAAEKRILEAFAAEHPFCWACGIGEGYPRDPMIDYPRHLVIHHVCKHLRVHERWNLCRLCSLCHDLAEGHRIVIVRPTGRRVVLPSLSLANILWLKRRHDPEHYRRAELAEHTRPRRRLPRIAQPPTWFLVSREKGPRYSNQERSLCERYPLKSGAGCGNVVRRGAKGMTPSPAWMPG